MTVDDTIGGSDRLLPDAALVKIEAATGRAATPRFGFTDDDREETRQDAVLEALSGQTPPDKLTDEEITRIANRCAKRVQRAKAKGKVISLDGLAETAGSHDPNIARRVAPLTDRQHAA